MSETELEGSNMSSTMAISKDNEKAEERRTSPREKMKHHVVLVFFGEDNWGKLTNMSESGMAFEFAKPPSIEERVNFTFQAMGCMPMPRDGKALGDSFEAPGKIVWTREFERGAGVQFVDLKEASREQIRQWLSFETSTSTSTPDQEPKPEGLPTLEELLAPVEAEPNIQTAADKEESGKESLIESDKPEPFAKRLREAQAAFLESSSAEEPSEEPVWGGPEAAAAEPLAPQLPAYSHPSVARLTFLVVSGCLAAFAVTAAIRIYMTRAAHQADAAVRASDSTPGMGVPTAEVNASPVADSVSAPVSTPVSSPAAPVASSLSSPVSAPPFQVGVLDSDGRSWILWFVRGEAKDKDNPVPSRPAGSSNSSGPTGATARRQEAASQGKPKVAHTFDFEAPNVSHPLTSNLPDKSSAEVPAIQPEITASSEEPFSGALGRQVAPAAPPPVPARTGGMVQQPRLIRSAPPVYPQLAKSTRASGDVVVDALIDATGNVTAVRVVSGPVLLRQAAMETVHQWKYEPARLDGQAVAMHLTVTVAFHLK